MNDIISRWVNNPSNVWIVIIVGALILIAGALFGFMRGWKSALYFATWNVLGLLVTVFIAEPITNSLIISKISDENTKKIVDIISPYLIPIMIIPILIIFNVISLIPYIFLRKIIRGKDAITGKTKKPDMSGRLIGMLVGLGNSLPITILTVNAVTITTGSTVITNMNKIGFNAVTFGQFPDMASNTSKIYSAAMIALSDNLDTAIDTVGKIFAGGEITSENQDWLKENHDEFENLLNWNDGHDILVTIMGDKFDSALFDSIENFEWPTELDEKYKFNISSESKKSLEKTMFALWSGDSKSDTEKRAIIKSYLDKISK